MHATPLDLFCAGLPARPFLLDLMCDGTALTRIAPRLARSQVWTLIGNDAETLDAVFEDIADWAAAQGWAVTTPRGAMLIHAPGGTWRVEGLRTLLSDPAALRWPRHDAVVCDVLPNADAWWLRRLAGALQKPLLGRSMPRGRVQLAPRDAHDAAVLRAVESQEASRAMFGDRCSARPAAVLSAALKPRGWQITTAPHDVLLRRGDLATQRNWIEQTVERAADWLHGGDAVLAGWQQRRLRAALAGRLTVRLPRLDFLAAPPQK